MFIGKNLFKNETLWKAKRKIGEKQSRVLGYQQKI